MVAMKRLAYLRAFLTLGFGLGDLLGPIASIIGIGSGVKNLIGGNQGGSKNSNTYVPTGLGEADQSWQAIMQQLQQAITGAGGQITPQLAQAFQAMLGAPVGDQYAALAPQATQAGSYLTGLGQGVGQAGQQLWNTSLDPQNELRNKIQQQVIDASRAGTSARGIGMGGESAGIENKAVTDFLLNWNNNQLQRQATGLQGYAGAADQAGRSTAGGLAAGALAPQYTAAGASWPMQASQMYTGALGGLNQQYGGALAQIIPYLNNGQGATGQAFDQGQTGLANLTYGAGKIGNSGAGNWLANLFGGGTKPTDVWATPGPGDWGNGQWDNPVGGG